jgi:hypothetical protein
VASATTVAGQWLDKHVAASDNPNMGRCVFYAISATTVAGQSLNKHVAASDNPNMGRCVFYAPVKCLTAVL